MDSKFHYLTINNNFITKVKISTFSSGPKPKTKGNKIVEVVYGSSLRFLEVPKYIKIWEINPFGKCITLDFVNLLKKELNAI